LSDKLRSLALNSTKAVVRYKEKLGGAETITVNDVSYLQIVTALEVRDRN
jgi:hypothetical protein